MTANFFKSFETAKDGADMLQEMFLQLPEDMRDANRVLLNRILEKEPTEELQILRILDFVAELEEQGLTSPASQSYQPDQWA